MTAGIRESLVPSVSGARAVLVASTGGHLAQLHRLAPQLGLADNPLWVTFDSEQSRSLLDGARVLHIPYIAPRDHLGVFRGMRIVSRELRQEQFDVVVSTGAAATLTALPQLLRPGKHVVYIESVSRFAGPSLTGRIMNAIPGTELYTQHASWADRKWKYHFSVLDEFGSVPAHAAPGSRPNVFVTLGTIRPYRFDRLVDQIVQIAPQAEIIWQLGETERADLPGKSHTYMSAGEFESTARAADVVISHAGVGTALRLLEMGICPVLVPRRRHFGEHVDDHQGQIADHLSDRNLAVVREASGLTWDDLMTAGSRQVVRAP